MVAGQQKNNKQIKKNVEITYQFNLFNDFKIIACYWVSLFKTNLTFSGIFVLLPDCTKILKKENIFVTRQRLMWLLSF